jgi:hypothetical protein
MKIQIAGKLAMVVWCALLSQRALAWSQEGHMVSGAIVFEDLRSSNPAVVERIAQLLAQHPDRGTFELALGRSTGNERLRRTFMEMARWPDDIRRGAYDHPTWHYASKAIIDARQPPPTVPAGIGGSAVEAFVLNARVVADARAPPAERAIALCWVLHLAGDIHQPLHAADRYSATHPNGDRGGNLQYVIDPQAQQTSLHSYWDQAVNRSSDAAPARADELRAKLPRQKFAELADRGTIASDFTANFNLWAAESYALASTQVYTNDLLPTASEQQATALSAAYVDNAVALAERRVTLASYRLADLLAVLLRE